MIETKFGRAKVCHDGYYRITTQSEGNHRKLLHRLIYADAHGPIPEGYVVHHIDGNRINNSIDNLELMPLSEHSSKHAAGENNGCYGRCREKNPNWKKHASIHKRGTDPYSGKQKYCLRYDGKELKNL